jgi:peptide/nickel transport system ATP-binding protein
VSELAGVTQGAGRNEVLRVRDLEIGYSTDRGRVRAVRGVSFDLEEDDSLAFIGESGSGKTTLGLSLVRLLPQSASIAKGEIVFNTSSGGELDLTDVDDETLRRFRWRECAIVFQSAQNALNPVMRIRAHFADTARDHAESEGVLKGRALTERARECLRLVQLDPERVLKAYPHELSGGMRQRVMIALGLLLNPRVLILDEPTTALDVLTQRAIIEVLTELREGHRFAMIFVSHDLSLAAELADRVATTYAGRIVELGDVEQVFYHPRHPYTVGLLDAVPTLAGEHQELSSIPGSPPDLIDLPTGCKFHPRCPYATDKCREEDPPLIEVAPGQTAACWHWEKVGSDWEARGGERHEQDANRA